MALLACRKLAECLDWQEIIIRLKSTGLRIHNKSTFGVIYSKITCLPFLIITDLDFDHYLWFIPLANSQLKGRSQSRAAIRPQWTESERWKSIATDGRYRGFDEPAWQFQEQCWQQQTVRKSSKILLAAALEQDRAEHWREQWSSSQCAWFDPWSQNPESRTCCSDQKQTLSKVKIWVNCRSFYSPITDAPTDQKTFYKIICFII